MVMIPLTTALKALAMSVVTVAGMIVCGGRACASCSRLRSTGGDGSAAQPEQGRKGAKAPKRDKKIMCEAGVQGPVHYTGVGQEAGGRYMHECQGFRGAWEVTRVVVDRQRPHQE